MARKDFLHRALTGFALGGACMLALSVGRAAVAQQSGGYRVGEDNPQASPAAPTPNQAAPVDRVARLSYVSGNVTWRPADSGAWVKASTNAALHQGSQIWISGKGRAAIQFDDGSEVRLGRGALATLETFYSDNQGEFTLIKLATGVSWLSLQRENSIYRIDTPYVSVAAGGPARIRVGVGPVVEVGVFEGKAAVEGKEGKTTVNAGGLLTVASPASTYQMGPLPATRDGWDRWNMDRDRAVYGAAYRVPGYRAVAVAAPPPAVWFSFGIPIGPVYPYHPHGRGWGRGIRVLGGRRRRHDR